MKIEAKIDLKDIKRLQKAGSLVADTTERTMQTWAVDVHKEIVLNLTGRKLKVRSGRLRSKMQFPLIQRRGAVIKAVFGNKVKYAAIHEYGGTTRPHDIFPRRAKALRFIVGGEDVFAKRVRHPGSKISEKRYIREPVEKGVPKLTGLLEKNIAVKLDGKQ